MPLTVAARAQLSSCQRMMIGKCIFLKRLQGEDLTTYYIRRHRYVKTVMKDQECTAWGALQLFSFFSLAGHIARMAPARWALRACAWRDMRWWRGRQREMRGTGPDRRRHVGQGAKACVLETVLELKFKSFEKLEGFNDLCISVAEDG